MKKSIQWRPVAALAVCALALVVTASAGADSEAASQRAAAGVLPAGTAAAEQVAAQQTSQSSYNRSAAVAWALQHAQDPEPFSAACAYFVSQALWAGGLPQTSQWTNDGHHGFLWTTRPGTPAATSVQPLLTYLRGTFSTTWTNITANLTTNAVPQAEPGDIIAYDWNGDGQLDHVAFVVSIQPGQYPNVSEWGTVSVWPAHHESTPYQQRGWTWSQLHHEWLQQEYGKAMRVYLLHFNDPTPPPPPPPATRAETTGSVTHTWTNFSNAGGNQGSSIPAFATVQIACKVTGFRVADGNTWWYRIASAPWNSAYYASADAFYNNGQTSGSLHGTPFVDPNVPNC